MNIYSGTLADLLTWFDTKQTDADILALLVADTHEARLRIRDLISEVDRLDIVLGQRVSLMLFGSTSSNEAAIRGESGKLGALGGEVLHQPLSSPQRLRHQLENISTKKLGPRYGKQFQAAVEKATFAMMQDIISTARITRNMMPCLVCYLRGVPEPITINLHDIETLTNLEGILRRIVNVYDATMSEARPWLLDVHLLLPRIKALEEANREADAKVQAITRALRGLRIKYRLPVDTTDNLIAGLENYRSPQDLPARLREIVGDPRHPILKDARIAKIQKLSSRLVLIREDLTAMASVPDFEFAVRSGMRHREAMSLLSRRISTMHTTLRSEAGAVKGRSRALMEAASVFDVLTSLGEKGYRLLDFLRQIGNP